MDKNTLAPGPEATNNLAMLGSAAAYVMQPFTLPVDNRQGNAHISHTSNMDVLATASLRDHPVSNPQNEQGPASHQFIYQHQVEHAADCRLQGNEQVIFHDPNINQIPNISVVPMDTGQLPLQFANKNVSVLLQSAATDTNYVGTTTSKVAQTCGSSSVVKISQMDFTVHGDTRENPKQSVANVMQGFSTLCSSERISVFQNIIDILNESDLEKIFDYISNQRMNQYTPQNLRLKGIAKESKSVQTNFSNSTEKHCSTCKCRIQLLISKPYLCSFCPKRFTRWRTCKAHMRKHTEKETFKCNICKQVFMSKEEMQSHRKSHSEEQKPFACALCFKRFTTSVSLKNHSNLHSGVKPFSCQYCSRRFAQKANLVTHEKLHTGDAPFSCDVCHKKFIRKDYLIDHQQATHAGRKLFTCKFCHKQFAWKNALKKHELQHTDNTVYPCKECGKVFPGKANLRMHIRIHSGEKPHACTYCPKRFLQRQDLNRHEMTHTGLKPFTCSMCGKGFVRGKELKKHVDNHHNDAKI